MRKNILFLVLVSYFNLVSNIHSAWGLSTSDSKIIFFSPLISADERKMVTSIEKDRYQVFSEYYLEKFPVQKNVDILLSEFENAQKYYLVNSKSLAQQYYEKVVSMKDFDDWQSTHRKIIFLSHVRLAELDTERQSDWIKKAIEFSAEIDVSELNISKKFAKLLREQKDFMSDSKVLWDVLPLKNDFRYILINGHRVDLNKTDVVKISSGQFRITFLSDSYKPQTYHLTAQQIPLITPVRIPFAEGDCRKPRINNEGESFERSIVLFYSQDCVKINRSGTWVSVDEASNGISRLTEVTPAHFQNNFKIEKPFYTKNWFWIGVGAVALGIVVSSFKKDSTSGSSGPTHETLQGK